MTFLEIGVFFAVSFAAAAVNAVAGGGTFLTFPVFILNGLSPLTANIMSTIALWPGTLASAHGYRKALDADKAMLVPFLIIGFIGGAAGALLLLSTPETVFEGLVPWLLLAATLIFTFGKKIKPSPLAGEGRVGGIAHGRKKLAMALQSITAIYGGYFGAGIGILTLAMLQILGMHDIHRMNALKVLLAGAINTITFAIFLFSGKVVWALAPVMIAGALAGGWCGAHYALKVSPRKVRFLVSVIGFAMTAYFFVYKM